MADYTLKNIPEDIYHRMLGAAADGFRSLNQEILFRLKRSLDAEDIKLTAVHARWVMEALESGPAKPLNVSELNAAFKRGVARAKAREKIKK